MALGPPVCEKCQVIGKHLTTPVQSSNIFSKLTHWICPVCGNTDMQDHAGLSTENIEKYRENLRFLLFCKGIS
jgi:hypothetical protein